MAINTYPSTSSTTTGTIASSSVVISSGLTANAAEGYYGSEYTVTKSLPRGVYQAYGNAMSYDEQEITVNGQKVILTSGTSINPITFVVTTAVSSYTVRVSSGWSRQTGQVSTFNLTTAVTGIAYGNGLFVAKSSGALYGAVSTDGLNWATSVMPGTNLQGSVYNQMSFANGYFMYGATPGTNLVISTDGLNWTTRTVLASNGLILKVTYGNGYYFAQTNNLYHAISTNLTTWASQTVPNFNSGNVAFVNNIFIGPGSNTIFVSTNATTWGTRTSPIQLPSGFAYNAGTYVMVGRDSSVQNIAVSTDANTWTLKASWSSGVNEIVYANGYFVTSGLVTGNLTGVFSSTDGNVWTSRVVGSSPGASSAYYLAGGNGIWVVANQNASGTARIYSAPNPAGYTFTGYDPAGQIYGPQTISFSGVNLDYYA